MSSSGLRIGLVASQFPLVTQTATIKDIYELERLGHDVHIYTMKELPWPEAIDPKALQFRDKVTGLGGRELASKGLPSALKAISPRNISTIARFLAKVSTSSNRGFFLRNYYCVAAGIHLAELGRAQKIDYFHANFGAAQALIAWVASTLSGIPYGFTTHAYDIYTEGHNMLMKEKVQNAALVATISEFNHRFMVQELGADGDKVEVHYCGIDPGSFPPRGQKLDDGGVPLILAIGSLTAQKGHDVLIRALGDLKRRDVDFQAVIVGEGIPGKNSLRGPLESLVSREGLQQTVELVGHVGQEELVRLLRTATVSVLACRQDPETNAIDGIPATLMESMAVGLPTVSTTVSGVPELIENGVSGLLVPPEDPTALADALALVLADPLLQANLAAGGREQVLDRFDITSNSRNLAARITAVVTDQVTSSA